MRVTVTFHGPFRVATGVARDGLGEVVDPDDLLPASSLKGLMRAAARQLLPGQGGLVAEVFGTDANRQEGLAARAASPWHWDDPEFPSAPRRHVRARVSIDPETGTAKRDFLVLGEELWADTASFTVTRRLPLAPETLRRHHVVLAASAAAVHALGADRRRGLGWVSCVPHDPEIDDKLLAELAALRSAHV